ncbi:MAG: phenylalanine--tRNA ligase subunit beta [Oscillospiraceae bacterium]|jgi:phenylalanyl-tRNA synthetase beta chain|nr:phenylalanine--tRNA ligase subunit beta [Oscillospiraceae bacterium]
MILSKKWLNDFVNTQNISDKEFAHMLTMTGSMVTGFEPSGHELSRVVVGKLLSVEKHPDAERLQICQTDVGQAAPIQIVTAATNVQAGQLVPVALDGSTLAGGIKIKKGKLRGVESHGMFCSLKELGLTLNDFPYAIEDGIFIIEEECEIGQDIHSAIGLDDVAFEFEITSNRPDCLSVTGLAREAAASFELPFKLGTPAVKAGGGDISAELKDVKIHDAELCPMYSARVVKDVKIEPSPRWIRERLRASGVRPINNIVDITNYVMLEYGQPMHAFDIRFIDEREINVRRAQNGEKITTLDGQERTLTSEMLVIADAAKPVAVAGVMGGEYSGIMEDTTTIVFESAVFNGASIRRTARALGMRTDASSRYEKGLDPNNCLPALERACELVELLGAGTVLDGIIADKQFEEKQHSIPLETEWLNSFLDIKLTEAEIVTILNRLDCTVKEGLIYVPTYRGDLEHKADIAEEVARIYGYNNIPSTGVKGSAQGKYTLSQQFESKISEVLRAQGYTEIITYSFISPKYYDKVKIPQDSPLRKSIVISNPLGEDTSIMRTTALPSMLEALARNYNNRNLSAALFELATEYIPDENAAKLPLEQKKIVLGLYGENNDFYALKGAVEVLLAKLGIDDYDVEAFADSNAYHPGRCAKLSLNGAEIGILGEIHPLVTQNYDLDIKLYAAELDLPAIFAAAASEKQYKPLPKYPAVTRDLAIICKAETPVIQLEKIIKSSAGKLLENVTLFDVYQGKQIEEGKKSVAYSITLRSSEASLTAEEAQAVVNKIIKALGKVEAELRA